MADDKYKSGPFKGLSKEEVKAARDFLRDSGVSVDEIAIMRILAEDFAINPPSLKKGGSVKSRSGPQDFRKGGMVLSTVDNRKKK